MKVVAAVFNRGNDYGLLDKLDTVFPNIKIITSISVGVERVDVKAYNKRGIKFCNSPGILDPVVAEFAIGLMLASARNIVKGRLVDDALMRFIYVLVFIFYLFISLVFYTLLKNISLLC